MAVGHPTSQALLGIAIGARGVETSNSQRPRPIEQGARRVVVGSSSLIRDAVSQAQLRRAKGYATWFRKRRSHDGLCSWWSMTLCEYITGARFANAAPGIH
jgi:hypothetical protein